MTPQRRIKACLAILGAVVEVTLQVGDRLVVVGTREQVKKAEEILRPRT